MFPGNVFCSVGRFLHACRCENNGEAGFRFDLNYAPVADSSVIIKALKPFGITMYSPLDEKYQLPTIDEVNRFLCYYRDNHQYDKYYNCDSFAWLMRAEVLSFSDGKIPFGYMEAEGNDPAYPFPNHAFCFVVTDDLSVWYCDELEVAAPADELYEAYPVRCHIARI